jgi:AraC-like DNA-binding protein
MYLSGYVSIDCADFAPPLALINRSSANYGCGQYTRSEHEWGTVSVSTASFPYATITEIKACVQQKLHVRQHVSAECTTVNSCYALSGKFASRLFGAREVTHLDRGKQNFIYKPVTADDHYVENEEPLHVFYIAVDRDYYMDLLDDGTAWCDFLRGRIERKKLVSGSSEPICITPSMRTILTDISNTVLMGGLNRLLLEAKILELTFQQLNHFMPRAIMPGPLRQKDREVFIALKEYLDMTFNAEHSLRKLSRQFGINEFKMKKGFKELFGDTVFGYIHMQRMNYARHLIEEEGLHICEVAGKVGYRNPNHFSVAFKKQFGFSPSLMKK